MKRWTLKTFLGVTATIALFAVALWPQTNTFLTTNLNQVITAVHQFVNGLQLGPTLFANLNPAAANGTEIFCSDCLKGSNPCAGVGAGVFAQRVSGAWVCDGSGSGASGASFSVNGTPTSSQSAINFQAGTGVAVTNPSAGNVLVTNTSPGGSFSVAGQGGFWGPGIISVPHAMPGTTVAGSTITTTIGQLVVTQFTLNAAWTVRKVTAILDGGHSGFFANYGVYSASGSLLLDAGAFNDNVATAQTNTLGSPVSLPSGTYFLAQSATLTTVNDLGLSTGGAQYATLAPIYNLNATRHATAANLMSGSAMPATLGALTPTNSFDVSIPFFEP